MTCPGTYPTVLNGQIYFNDSSTVEYECLSGFSMSGNKRITCTAGVWETEPTCSVIRQYDDVDVDTFPDWWLILLGVLLALMVLACFLCLICYFCCCRGGNVVHPYRHRNTAVCCGGGCGSAKCCGCCDQRRTDDMDGMENGGMYYDRYRPPAKNRSTDTEDFRRTRMKSKATGTDHDDTRVSYVYNYGGGTTAMYNGTDSYAWNEGRGSKVSGTKAWNDSSNFETRSDGELNGLPPKPKKPAKEVRAWLPHSNPVRKINTSTK